MHQYLMAYSTFVLATIKRPLNNGAVKSLSSFPFVALLLEPLGASALPLLASRSTATIDNPPTEILALIFNYLPAESPLSLRLVCKKLLSASPLERTGAHRDFKAVQQVLIMLMKDSSLLLMLLCQLCPKFTHWKVSATVSGRLGVVWLRCSIGRRHRANGPNPIRKCGIQAASSISSLTTRHVFVYSAWTSFSIS